MNNFVQQRLQAYLHHLKLVHQSGSLLASASKGNERDAVIKCILSAVVGPTLRIGTGEITDLGGNQSGQLDIVIEYPHSISLPAPGLPDGPRQYMAEGVCAVIEVKSNLASQWNQVEKSYEKVAPLRRHFTGPRVEFRGGADVSVPYFVVGYRGWGDMDAICRRRETSGVSGIFVIEEEEYCGKTYKGTGSCSVLVLLHDLATAISGMVGGSASDFLKYGGSFQEG